MPEATELVNFRVPTSFKETLDAQAFAERVSVSHIIRKAVADYLDDQEPVRRKALKKASKAGR